MRKLSIITAFLAMAVSLQGQVFSGVSVKKLPGTGASDVKIAGISENGDFVLTTSGSNCGLKKIVLQTAENEVITSASGAGFQPSISSDGAEIIFREVQWNEEHMRMTAVKSMTLPTRQLTELRRPSREVKAYGFRGKEAFAMSDENRMVMKSKAVNVRMAEEVPVVFTEDLQLMLSKGGKTLQLSPNGTEESYLWPSLSPDGQKILYYVSGEGAYVCDLNGSNVTFIHHDCRAPQWWDDNTVIGMDDKDDGEMIVSSCIMAYSLNGGRQQLTTPGSLTMYPQCAPKAGVVACSDVNGGIHLISLTK